MMNIRKPFPHWQAWLELLRLPNLFTVPGDILVGWVVVGMKGSFPFIPILASLAFYSAGLLFNDLFDFGIDAKERPSRPLPSHRVRKLSVLIVGVLLSVSALLLSAWFGALYVGCTLLGMILFYNLFAKHISTLGVVVMGGCRGLNILLGAAMTWTWEAVPLGSVYLHHAILFFTIYIIIVSIVARNEASPSEHTRLSMRLLPLGMVVLLLPLSWFYGKWMWLPTCVVALCYLPDLVLRRSISNRVAAYIRGLIPLQGLWCLLLYRSMESYWLTLFLFLWGGAWLASFRYSGS